MASNRSVPVVELLTKAHNRVDFDCGEESLNHFLKQYAMQNQARHYVRTYVCCKARKILGYYSLAYGSVSNETAPAFLSHGMGKYSIPTMILGRLAIDKPEQGKGLGAALLKDAIMRTRQAAEIAGLKAILVHAHNETAKHFYAQYGFISAPHDPLTLFFPINFEL